MDAKNSIRPEEMPKQEMQEPELEQGQVTWDARSQIDRGRNVPYAGALKPKRAAITDDRYRESSFVGRVRTRNLEA